ncbi:MAG: excisionase family DNA-binding protein [Candidatus Thorarchaeota archaeon]|nr:excisionase family DNA-binding protein [Candidatus Thorarchaeota archaeon]
MPTLMLTVSHAATVLGVCTTTTRRWEAAGLLTCLRTPGGHRRVPLEEVARLSAVRCSTGPLGPLHPPPPHPPDRRAAGQRTTAVYARVSSHGRAPVRMA